MQAHPVRRPALAVLVTLAALAFLAPVLGLLGASSADAAVYRYWGYFHGNGSGGWTFASTGPASYVPTNGAVEGWRYAVVGKQTRYPRTKSDFREVCPTSTNVPTESKAVAVYLDFGLAAEAPPGSAPPEPTATCVVTAAKATGAAVLAKAGNLRLRKGLTCAIDGYPGSGCGGALATTPPVKMPEPPVRFTIAGSAAAGARPPTATSPTHTPSATAVAAPSAPAPAAASSSHTVRYVLIAVLVAVLLGLGGAFLAGRRRS